MLHLTDSFAQFCCRKLSHNTQVGADYMKKNVSLCSLPAYPETKVSHKQQDICGLDSAALTTFRVSLFLLIDKMCSTMVFHGLSPVQS